MSPQMGTEAQEAARLHISPDWIAGENGFKDTWLYHKVYRYVQTYMARYDMSHDFSHIRRVSALADRIFIAELAIKGNTMYKHEIVLCAALLHDVGDRKYAGPGENSDQLILELLRTSNEDQWHPNFAQKVLAIVKNVSFSNEMKHPQQVQDALAKFPELAIVQDADRLDAIGAVGIARCFAYGAVKSPDRGLQGSIDHFTEKLENLESMMKTKTGKGIARERTRRLTEFRGWWIEETLLAEV